MSRPTAEQWALVTEHLELGHAIARAIALPRGDLMPVSELLDQLEDAALDGLIVAATTRRPETVPYRAWAIGCVSRKCLERVRALCAAKRRPRHLQPLAFDPPDARPAEGGSPPFAELVSRLSPTERQVLSLRYAEDLTQAEAGDVLGISGRSIRRIEAAAFERLRRAEGA